MSETRFDTRDVPRPQRWLRWKEFFVRSQVAVGLETAAGDDFEGELRVLRLGAVQVSSLSCGPLEMVRTPQLVRQHDPGMCQVVLHLGGRLGVTRTDRTVELGLHDLLLSDSGKPWRSWARSGDELARFLMVLVPRHLMPLRAEALAPLHATPVPARRGPGAMLARHLVHLAEAAPDCTPADAVRLGSVTVDLLAATYAHHLESASGPLARQDALLVDIHTFIEHRLGERDLTPRTVAAAHSISVRQLHRLFEGQNMCVAAWIRRRRLERCRSELADPRHGHRSVAAIAARRGFDSGAHFSRVFRRAYGTAPSHYRSRPEAAAR